MSLNGTMGQSCASINVKFRPVPWVFGSQSSIKEEKKFLCTDPSPVLLKDPFILPDFLFQAQRHRTENDDNLSHSLSLFR